MLVYIQHVCIDSIMYMYVYCMYVYCRRPDSLHKPVGAICDEKELLPFILEPVQKLWQFWSPLGVMLCAEIHVHMNVVQPQQHMYMEKMCIAH